MNPPRGVVEGNEVTAIKDAYEAKNPHIGNAWAALTWSLAIEPEPQDSLRLDGKYRLYTQAGESFNNVPSISVVYSYDARYIEFFSIRFNDTPPVLIAESEKAAASVE